MPARFARYFTDSPNLKFCIFITKSKIFPCSDVAKQWYNSFSSFTVIAGVFYFLSSGDTENEKTEKIVDNTEEVSDEDLLNSSNKSDESDNPKKIESKTNTKESNNSYSSKEDSSETDAKVLDYTPNHNLTYEPDHTLNK